MNSIAVIGGDLRNLKLAEMLAEDGYQVKIFGFRDISTETGIMECANLNMTVKNADLVVGPIPCSNDNETINAPFHYGKIYVNEVFGLMNAEQLFIAGRIDERLRKHAAMHDISYIDILEREEMAVLNAIPTAEGAVQIAMEETPITIHSAHALVIGFGRVGRVLAEVLKGLGAHVYIAARKAADFAWIKSLGYIPLPVRELTEWVGRMDMIFNTVPVMLLDRNTLVCIKKESLIIDLASKPGGVDFEAAKEKGLKVVWALSLPGKVAPVSAAQYFKDTIKNIVSEREE